MTYFPRTEIEFADSTEIDAFGRLRVGEPFTLFDSKQISDDRGLFWTQKFISNASASYTTARASTILTASTTVGSLAVRQTKQYFNYQPGKSLMTDITFVFGASASGIRKRCGYFDDSNGIFVEDFGGNKNIVLRSSVTGQVIEQRITQSMWNIDKLDGTGQSAKTIDFTKAQIFHIDLQWLGVGRVRAGFEQDGSLYNVHQFLNTNVSSSVYMSTPNLPVRFEVENVSSATTGTLEQICSTVVSEGGYDKIGVRRSVNRGTTAVSGSSNIGLTPVLSIRLKAANSGSSTVIPFGGSVFCNSNAQNGYIWAVVYNPAFGGTDQATWVSVLSSSVEYDVSRNSTNSLTGGLVLASGYGTNTTSLSLIELQSNVVLGSSVRGVTDQIVLAAQPVGAQSETFLGSFDWREHL